MNLLNGQSMNLEIKGIKKLKEIIKIKIRWLKFIIKIEIDYSTSTTILVL